MDINLVQSLDGAQRLAEDGERTGPGWDRLRSALSTAMGHVTEDVDDVGYQKPQTGDRIDRIDPPDPDLVQQVRAALTALRDRPDDDRAGDAADHVERLNEQLS